MTSNLLGEGLNGTVRAEQFAVKTYDDTEFYIARDAIREASILNHLNDNFVIGVPKLYNTNVVHNNESTTTTSVMSLAGRSLMSILLETEDTTERCMIVEPYLDSILEVIGAIHRAGIIHNDLNLGNILINEDTNEVTIIDFGLSTFNSAYDIDSSFNSPEQHRYEKNLYATDYWILGVAILNFCLGRGYAPIQGDSDWSQIIDVLDREYTLNELETQEVHTSVIIPDSITPRLADRLKPLLQYNHLDRELDPHRPEVTLSKFNPALNRDYINTLSTTLSYLARIFKAYFLHSHPSRLGVAIDILRRILVPLGGIAHSQEAIQSLVLAIAMILHTYPGREMVELNSLSIEKISALEVKILSILRWRILTESNVRLSDNGNMKTLCDRIIDDKDRYMLMEMSDEELYGYFRG